MGNTTATQTEIDNANIAPVVPSKSMTPQPGSPASRPVPSLRLKSNSAQNTGGLSTLFNCCGPGHNDYDTSFVTTVPHRRVMLPGIIASN